MKGPEFMWGCHYLITVLCFRHCLCNYHHKISQVALFAGWTLKCWIIYQALTWQTAHVFE